MTAPASSELSPSNKTPKFAVIGGGITGLAAAYEALNRGERDIHVYEASQRLGGKIESGEINGSIVNRGAEFIDSDNANLLALCEKFNVNLVENKGMELEQFQRPNGTLMDSDSFYAAYRPYARQIIADRKEMQDNPQGARAQHIHGQSAQDYLNELGQSVAPASRNLWKVIKDTALLRGNESPTTLAIAAQAYAAEVGQPAANISAAQFIAETSPDMQKFFTSDCSYRVEGGTEQLVARMRDKLAAQGVTFHTGSELESLSRQGDGKLHLAFANPEHTTQADRIILALPTYALSKIKGLDTLGFSQQSLADLGNTQYTKSIKYTVAFKPGMETPDAAFFSNCGFQTWSPAPGMLTFLANTENIGSAQSPAKFLTTIMDAYARSHNSTAAEMFDFKKNSFSNPGSAPCYATPHTAQLDTIEQLRSQLPALAANGIGIAGSFLPHQNSYGFMECGVASAAQSVDLLLGKEKLAEIAPDITPDTSHIKPNRWADQIITQRNPTGHGSIESSRL